MSQQEFYETVQREEKFLEEQKNGNSNNDTGRIWNGEKYVVKKLEQRKRFIDSGCEKTTPF